MSEDVDVESIVQEAVDEATAELRDRVDELEQRVEEVEREKRSLSSLVEALKTVNDTFRSQIGELQSRELEKGGHLDWENVEPSIANETLSVDNDRVERFRGDEGETWGRMPGSNDPLQRSGTSAFATGDLLPIQQLARMDDETLAASTSRPQYIAARIWRARGNDAESLWQTGSGPVKDYVDASDVRIFIKRRLEREDETLSDEYAKKLARRSMDAIREFARDRVYIDVMRHTKDGLEYRERRLIVPSDAEIPGEQPAEEPAEEEETPATDGVPG